MLSTEEPVVIPGSPATAPLRRLLTELADSGSTGALHVDGTPGGTFYLVSGRITHAESPACPNVGERLVGSGRLHAQTWQDAFDAGYADRTVGRRLVVGGHLVQGELVCRVLATICDATHEILRSDHAQVRFVPEERHWLGLITQIELTALSRETVRRRLLAPPAAAEPARAAVPEPVVEEAATVEAPSVEPPAEATASRPITLSGEPAVPVPSTVLRDGPWAGRPDAARRTPPNAAPAQREGRAAAAPNSRAAVDYATLKRIRRALTSIA
jgi:hypothetical protein